jgi:hypothetical protein
VQVLDGAAHFVSLAHEFVMARPDKEFAPALKLLRGFARVAENKTVNASRVLMDALQRIELRPCLNIKVQHSVEPPMVAALPRSREALQPLRNRRCLSEFVSRHFRIWQKSLAIGTSRSCS